jgi:hypothetical protein
MPSGFPTSSASPSDVRRFFVTLGALDPRSKPAARSLFHMPGEVAWSGSTTGIIRGVMREDNLSALTICLSSHFFSAPAPPLARGETASTPPDPAKRTQVELQFGHAVELLSSVMTSQRPRTYRQTRNGSKLCLATTSPCTMTLPLCTSTEGNCDG